MIKSSKNQLGEPKQQKDFFGDDVADGSIISLALCFHLEESVFVQRYLNVVLRESFKLNQS